MSNRRSLKPAEIELTDQVLLNRPQSAEAKRSKRNWIGTFQLSRRVPEGVEQLTGKAKEPSPTPETGAEAAHGEIKANCPSEVSSTNPVIGNPQ